MWPAEGGLAYMKVDFADPDWPHVHVFAETLLIILPNILAAKKVAIQAFSPSRI